MVPKRPRLPQEVIVGGKAIMPEVLRQQISEIDQSRLKQTTAIDDKVILVNLQTYHHLGVTEQLLSIINAPN